MRNSVNDRGVTKFSPLSLEALLQILGITVKNDNINKLIVFLNQLSAFTESDQFNISFNAPSSTGKSYIPLEISSLFPSENVIKIGYCSPTAFFHDHGKYDKATNTITVDLSNKIIIFLDQPHMQLVQKLRPLLSHDEKEIMCKITDKSQKYGMRTKNVLVRGFASVLFCTAGLRIDEQEATRFFILSPETTQEKIRNAILQKITKEADRGKYFKRLNDNPERKLLKERIKAIRDEKISTIKIPDQELVEKMFFERAKYLKPRHARDIGRIMSLAKTIALINLWWRKESKNTLTVEKSDIEGAFNIWDQVSESQELNIPPYIYEIYTDIILPLSGDKEGYGIKRSEIYQAYNQRNGRPLPEIRLRLEIIPMLESAGLIFQEPDPDDKRRLLIYPTVPYTISDVKRNSVAKGGVQDILNKFPGATVVSDG